MIDVQAYPVSGRPGRYQTDKSIIYLPGKTYKLTVEVGGQVLSSKNTIPKSLNFDTKTDLTTYTCMDGTILSIPEINVNNMDENGELLLIDFNRIKGEKPFDHKEKWFIDILTSIGQID